MKYAEYIDRIQSSDDIAAMERCSPYIRKFEEQRENGLDGVLKQAEIVHEASVALVKDFSFFANLYAGTESKRPPTPSR